MATLCNPTNEVMQYFHGGVTYRFEPGDIRENVNEAAANHLMTHLFPRGLVSLQFSDGLRPEQMEAQKEEGRKRNAEFKERQVIKYNQLNKAREQTSREHLPPTRQIEGYAEELEIKLEQPYSRRESQGDGMFIATQRALEAEKRADNLSREMNELKDVMSALLDQIEAGNTAQKEEPKTKKKSK